MGLSIGDGASTRTSRTIRREVLGIAGKFIIPRQFGEGSSMALPNFFKRRKPPFPQRQMYYCIAYVVHPGFAYENFEFVQQICRTKPSLMSEFMCDRACRFLEVEAAVGIAQSLKWHLGEFSDGRTHLTLEYPVPAPFNPSAASRNEVETMQEATILAPFFSCATRDTRGTVCCYVLGQQPIGSGATLRGVLPSGTHGRLWSLATPTLEAFHAHLATDDFGRFFRRQEPTAQRPEKSN